MIETAEGISGPYCGKLFAEYGADVIKVERPGDGDPSRGRSSWPSHSGDIEKSPLFLHLNRGKRGVTLDLETDAGRSLFRQLVSNADVLIESSAPGYMDSIGLGYESLRELNPGLVMTSVTPFGQTGPHKDYQYTELTIFATGGAMFREGRSDREPLKYGGEMGQYFAGTAASAATMGAYFWAFMTGQGEWIDISLQECIAGHPHQIGRRAPFDPQVEDDPALGETYGQPDQLFRRGSLAYEAERLGPPVRSSRGMALLDLEADGTWEIAVANQDDPPTLWRRAEPAHGSWIRFRLVDPEGNRDGLGARIGVTGVGAAQSRWVRAGGSYASDSERTVHFGLGSGPEGGSPPESAQVEVRWPDGMTETHPALAAGTTWLLRRGAAPIALPRP